MAATFKWEQTLGTGSATATYSTGNVVNFFGGTSSVDTAVYQIASATANYNNTASNIQAGSNSWPVWLKFRFECATNGTFNNLKFWRYTESSGSLFNANTGSMNVVGTVVAAYAVPTSRATATAQASNAAVPTSSSSTSAPGSPLVLGSVSTSNAGTIYGGSMICYQLTTATNAPAGDTGAAAFTGQYDEN